MALENDDRATSEGGFDRWQGPDEAFIFARIAEKSWLPFAYSSWRTTSRPFFLARSMVPLAADWARRRSDCGFEHAPTREETSRGRKDHVRDDGGVGGQVRQGRTRWPRARRRC
jgi:hypothetical protein